MITEKTRPLSLMMIDDDKDDAFLVKYMLSKVDSPVYFEHVSDSTAFMKIISDTNTNLQELADIILLDINMPNISGFDLLERMNERFDLSKIEIIVFSTSDAEYDAAKAHKLGASKFVTKPSTPGALLEFLTSIADHQNIRNNKSP